jgi:hypothetical protein
MIATEVDEMEVMKSATCACRILVKNSLRASINHFSDEQTVQVISCEGS